MEVEVDISKLQEEINTQKDTINRIKEKSKESENELKAQVLILEDEKNNLIAGIEARMQLIDILKRDITRMAYEEALRIADGIHSKPLPKKA